MYEGSSHYKLHLNYYPGRCLLSLPTRAWRGRGAFVNAFEYPHHTAPISKTPKGQGSSSTPLSALHPPGLDPPPPVVRTQAVAMRNIPSRPAEIVECCKCKPT